MGCLKNSIVTGIALQSPDSISLILSSFIISMLKKSSEGVVFILLDTCIFICKLSLTSVIIANKIKEIQGAGWMACKLFIKFS